MKVFETYEKLFAYGVIRPELLKTPSQKFTARWKVPIINIMTAYGWFTLLSYLIKEAREFREYSESIYALTTLATTMFGLSNFEWKKVGQFKLIDNFKTVMQERSSNPVSKAIYKRETDFVEKWHQILNSAFIKVTIPSITVPYFLWSYFLYFSTDLGSEAFYLPFMIWAPVNWKTPIMYPVAFIAEAIVIYYAIMFCVVFMCFPFGTCHFMTAFADDIKAELITLNDLCALNRADFFKKLHKTIAFHATAKKFANDFNDTYQFIITNFFLWALSTICNMLLLFQIEFTGGTPNISALLKLSALSFWAYLSIYMLCNSGDTVVSRYQEIDVYNLCDWYKYPGRARRLLPFIIMNSQPKISIQAYGNIHCSKETFKMLSNKGLSFFMIFRQFVK